MASFYSCVKFSSSTLKSITFAGESVILLFFSSDSISYLIGFLTLDPLILSSSIFDGFKGYFVMFEGFGLGFEAEPFFSFFSSILVLAIITYLLLSFLISISYSSAGYGYDLSIFNFYYFPALDSSSFTFLALLTYLVISFSAPSTFSFLLTYLLASSIPPFTSLV